MKVFICIILLIILFFSFYALKDKDMFFISLGNFIVIALTLIAIVIYVMHTEKIAIATQKNLEITSKVFEESQNPLISLIIEPDLSPNSWQTIVTVKNFSNFNTKVYVNLQAKVYGNLVDYSEEYDGRKYWSVSARQAIHGHFSIKELLNKIGRVPHDMAIEQNKNNIYKQLTLDIKVEYEKVGGKRIYNPIQSYHFDFNLSKWIYDVTPRTTEKDNE